MIFRQIVGRFVRTGQGGGDESWLLLPAEPVLRAHAAKVEDEIHRVLKRHDDFADGELGRATVAPAQRNPSRLNPSGALASSRG